MRRPGAATTTEPADPPPLHPMPDFLFDLFALLTVLAAAGVVLNRNAVNAAMCLLLSFVGMAALFVLLEAYFLALLQVLVYAGAVVVLFLFIIMLFDVQGGAPRRPYRPLAAVSGALALALLALGVLSFYRQGRLASPPAAPGGGASLKDFGDQLFTTYLLPMQVTGFLLLIAMLGVTVLSRKYEPKEGA
jgi:NADH-quinone oxidoreductase subunit J